MRTGRHGCGMLVYQSGIANLCVSLRDVSELAIPATLRICKTELTVHRERMLLRGRLASTVSWPNQYFLDT